METKKKIIFEALKDIKAQAIEDHSPTGTQKVEISAILFHIHEGHLRIITSVCDVCRFSVTIEPTWTHLGSAIKVTFKNLQNPTDHDTTGGA